MTPLTLAEGISASAIRTFLSENAVCENYVHTFAVYEKGKCLARFAPDPYDCTEKREVYSLSKSFCSTAIGLLCDDGLLSVNDRISDIFPEEMPDTATEDMMQMTVQDVLTMRTGHDRCVFYVMCDTMHPVRAFFETPLAFKPGTRFAYNTGATYLLSIIVTKKTGKALLDFLNDRIFHAIGIHGVGWTQTKVGANEGGVGLQLSCDDMVKFGQLYLNGGMWEGKRLLSEAWIKEASSPIADNGTNGTDNWTAGYGYQFWINAKGGFRADGAAGQFLVMLPEKETLIAVQSESRNINYLMCSFEAMLNGLKEADPDRDLPFPDYYAPLSGKALPFEGENILYRADPNPMGITEFCFRREGDVLTFCFSDGSKQWEIHAGNGRYLPSTVIMPYMTPKLSIMHNDFPEVLRGVGSWETKDGAPALQFRMVNTPWWLQYRFTVSDNRAEITVRTAHDGIRPFGKYLSGTAV